MLVGKNTGFQGREVKIASSAAFVIPSGVTAWCNANVRFTEISSTNPRGCVRCLL